MSYNLHIDTAAQVPHTHTLSLSLYVSVSPCVSVFVSLSLCFSLPLSHSLSILEHAVLCFKQPLHTVFPHADFCPYILLHIGTALLCVGMVYVGEGVFWNVFSFP